MKHEKTFEAIYKLKDIEIELHRLKNALEMANKALDAQRTWVGLDEEDDIDWDGTGNLKQLVEAVEAKLKEKNNVLR